LYHRLHAGCTPLAPSSAAHPLHRISSIVWHCVLGNAPSYLLELLLLTSACSGRRSLRSASKGDFLVPRARNATRQKRAFSIVCLSVWNDFPPELRSLPRDLSSSFYKLLPQDSPLWPSLSWERLS